MACGSIGTVLNILRQRRLSGWLCLLSFVLQLTAAFASPRRDAGGKTTTNLINFGVSIEHAANGAVLSKNYGNGALSEVINYGADGLPTAVGTGSERRALTYEGEDGRSRQTKNVSSGYNVSETFFKVGLRASVSGFDDARLFKYHRMVLAEEEHTEGPWDNTTLSYGQDERGRLSSLDVGNLFEKRCQAFS